MTPFADEGVNLGMQDALMLFRGYPQGIRLSRPNLCGLDGDPEIGE
jgi:2-polyprenyl-6-methoxyphenol hydroxylase-like FAD-dependent oxidoreductase